MSHRSPPMVRSWFLSAPLLRNGAKRVIAVACLLIVGAVSAADWPQFRGPDRNGASKETGLLKTWPEKGLTPAWIYRNAGEGHSSFAIVKGKLYTCGTRGADDIVLAIDAASGKELWTAKIGPLFTFKKNTWGDGPRSTPTIDGDLLYALGGYGDLVCVDISQQGKEVWRKNLAKDFGGEMMGKSDSAPFSWGYSESILVDGANIICTPGGQKGTLAALDKKTGGLVWQSAKLTHSAPYASPIKATIQGVPQYIQASYKEMDGSAGYLNGFAVKDGAVLWSEKLFDGESYSISTTPIVSGDIVYVSTGWEFGCRAYQFGPDLKPKQIIDKKFQNKFRNNHGGVVLLDGNVYGHSENLNWVCQALAKPGKILWSEKEDLRSKSGSIASAEGLLYCLTEDGQVGLVEANPKAWTKVSEFELPEKSKLRQKLVNARQSAVWAHPVIVDGHLFLRDTELIFCFDIRAK